MRWLFLGMILAALVVACGGSSVEGRLPELQDVQTAVTTAMSDHSLTSISPVAATNDMTSFPDTTTVIGGGTPGASDVKGLRLYNHDTNQTNNAAGPFMRFTFLKITMCKYLVQSDGNVMFASKADNTVGTLDPSLADCA